MKVSVFIVTYNQKEYIAECIDSILMQQCDFDLEIIIGDDYSADGTTIICHEYAQKYRNITLLPSVKNIGIAKNWKRVLSYCKGNYIAMCEGDDYWIDPMKLKKQINFLENNPDYSAISHDVIILDNINSGRTNVFFKHDMNFQIQGFENFLPTCSLVFRNNNVERFFPDFTNSKIMSGDKLLVLNLLSLGKIKYLEDKMAVYRIHDKGVAVNAKYENLLMSSIETNEFLLRRTEFNEIRKEIKKSQLILFGNLSLYYFPTRKLSYLRNLWKSASYISCFSDLKILLLDYIFKKSKNVT